MYIPAKMNTKLIRILQKYLLVIFLYFFISPNTYSQVNINSLKQQKKKLEDSLINLGYWEAIVEIENDSTFKIEEGKPYLWSDLKVYEKDARISISSLDKQIGKQANQYILKKALQKYLVENYHKSGYPLAKANLTIEGLNANNVLASVYIKPQNYIVYDSLDIKSSIQSINSSYLSNALNLEIGRAFNIKDFRAINTKIESIDQINLSSSPTLKFENNKAIIGLDLIKETSNQFDAFIGLVPNGDEVNITGQVDTRLRNLFKRGVALDIFWQKYSANSQTLATSLSQSYAFKTDLGVSFDFNLLQEDSTFLQTDLNIGLEYPFWKSLTLGVSYKRQNNGILREFSPEEIDDIAYRSSETNAIQLSADWNRAINYPVLKNDYYLESAFGIGGKRILNYSSLPEVWQDVPENSLYFSTRIKLHFQRRLAKRFLIEIIPQYNFIENSALSQNDLLRLGGLQNLRGFDRNYFYSRYYTLLNLNYRYFLDNESSVFLLTDIAKLQPVINWTYAFGAGLDVRSKNGWFRIIYALGNELDENVDFRQAKIHFGYIAVF